MKDKTILEKYESFLKLNHLKLSSESAIDFTDLEEDITPLMLSMEYVNKGVLLRSRISKKKYFNNALLIEPNNFAAKICLLETTNFTLEEYKKLLDLEYERLLKENYLEPKYYKDNIIEFQNYQDTFNYIRGLRSYYIALISAYKLEDAISIGQQLLELNPADFFHVKGSLAILYLGMKDTVSALFLIESNENLIIGTKELIESYSAYLNHDDTKALEYLNDLLNCNPYLYRLLTKEAKLDLNPHPNDEFADSTYIYVHFTIVVHPDDGFDKIIDTSLEAHPIIDDLTQDEFLVLETGVLANLAYYNLNAIKEESIHYTLVKNLATYSDNRILGILDSLKARGILKNYELSVYGELYDRRIKEALNEVKEDKKKQALSFIDEGHISVGITLLEEAIDYAPSDYELKKLILFHEGYFNFKYAKSLIDSIQKEMKDHIYFYSSGDFSRLEELIRIHDEICYRYFKEALIHGNKDILYSLNRKEEYNLKYQYFIEMASILEGKMEVNDLSSIFSKLYYEYKTNNFLSYERIKSLLSLCKELYRDVKIKSPYMPYSLLDPIFAGNLERAIDIIPLEDILTRDEILYLTEFYEEGNTLDLHINDPIYMQFTYEFIKSGFLILKDGDISLASFVKDYYKNKK